MQHQLAKHVNHINNRMPRPVESLHGYSTQLPESTDKKSLTVTTQDSNQRTSDPSMTIQSRLLCHIVQNSGWGNLEARETLVII